jgi:hypothetical protein
MRFLLIVETCYIFLRNNYYLLFYFFILFCFKTYLLFPLKLSYWWHQVTSVTESVSLTFWFNPSPPEYTYPLSESQVVAVRRNIEKMMGMTIGPANVAKFLKEILDGRFHESLELNDPSQTRVYGNPNIFNMLDKDK